MSYIDLTAELADGMVRHPAPHLPAVELTQAATHEEHARSVQRLVTGTHVSTHIDAPLHAIPGGASIDQISLDVLCGEALLLHLPEVSKAQPVDLSDLASHAGRIASVRRIVLHTGWAAATWGTRSYFTDGPYLTRAATKFLAGFDVPLIGMDFPNIDSVEETISGTPAPNHQIYLGTGGVLLENLLELAQIPDDRFELLALPLRLIGGDGCPCRAIARLLDDRKLNDL